jgi:hypothetical protein
MGTYVGCYENGFSESGSPTLDLGHWTLDFGSPAVAPVLHPCCTWRNRSNTQCLGGSLTLLTQIGLFQAGGGRRRNGDAEKAECHPLGGGEMLTLLTFVNSNVNPPIVEKAQCLCGLLTLLTQITPFLGVKGGRKI